MHFFGAAAEAMRRILIDHARRKARIKRFADKIAEVDKKRIADSALIILQLKSLGNTITKSVIQSEPRPEPTHIETR